MVVDGGANLAGDLLLHKFVAFKVPTDPFSENIIHLIIIIPMTNGWTGTGLDWGRMNDWLTWIVSLFAVRFIDQLLWLLLVVDGGGRELRRKRRRWICCNIIVFSTEGTQEHKYLPVL